MEGLIAVSAANLAVTLALLGFVVNIGQRVARIEGQLKALNGRLCGEPWK